MFDEKLKEALARLSAQRSERADHRLRPDPVALGAAVQLVTTAAAAEEMASQLARMDVAVVGLDTEFQYGGPTDEAAEDWDDLSHLKPISLGLTALARTGTQVNAVRYAVDLRKPETHPALARVLKMPFKFAVHFLKAEYMALAALGLPWPTNVFDTWLAARLLDMGRHHKRYIDTAPRDERAEIEAEAEAERQRVGATSLLGVAAEFGVEWPFTGNKDAMRSRYLSLPDDAELGLLDAEYVCADAFTTAALVEHLLLALLRQGLLHHYEHIELPAAVAFAEIERQGITVDRSKLAVALKAAEFGLRAYEGRLEKFGFTPIQSTPREVAGGAPASRVMVQSFEQRKRVLEQHGLLDLFRSGATAAGYSFNKDAFKRHRARHEIIELLYLHSKYSAIARDPLFHQNFIGSDGRVHPLINPLGADSGRPSFKKPNIVGIGKNLRPVVVPDGPDLGIMELDFASQEIFIAAAHFGDEALLADCNAGDPYVRMARTVRSDDIAPGDEGLSDSQFAKKYGDLRDSMKVLVLATFYGMSDESIQAQAKLASVLEARELREKLFQRYSQLKAGMDLAVTQPQQRGYSTTVSGLKRFRRDVNKPLSGWETRWAINAPIQGGAACILKLAVPRVARFLDQHGGRILITPYDAVVVQYLLGEENFIAAGVADIMKRAMKELYPGTEPRIDVNHQDPSCWNKKGRGDSIDRFLENPDFKP